MELAPGAELDRYAVEALIGEGGMAVVYRVRHRTLGSLHALKVLTVTSPKLRDRLVREGRVQATLQHPNIVGVTDIIDVQGAPGLIMQFVDGPSLEAWLEEGPQPLPQAERIFLGILDAVEAAHAVGVIHRDLKPANVLLARLPGGLVPRVADFGIARALSEGEVMRATRTGAAMGTPAFMAPEQIRDARSVDHRADVFSLGCILYEMVTGTPAFGGNSVLDVFEAISSGRYVPPLDRTATLPPGLANAIEGALVADRELRIPDCATLRAVIRGERVWAVAAPAPRPPAVPHPGIPGAPDTLSPRPGAAAATMGFEDDGPPDAAAPTAIAPMARRARWVPAASALALAVAATVAFTWPRQPSGPTLPPDEPTPEQAVPGMSGETVPVRALDAGAGGESTGTAAADVSATSGGSASGQADGAGSPPPDPAAGTARTGDAGRRGGADQAVTPTAPVGVVTADAPGVRLIGPNGSLALGPVPPGHYSIQWTREGGAVAGAGTIDVEAGETVALHCDVDFRSCEPVN